VSQRQIRTFAARAAMHKHTGWLIAPWGYYRDREAAKRRSPEITAPDPPFCIAWLSCSALSKGAPNRVICTPTRNGAAIRTTSRLALRWLGGGDHYASRSCEAAGEP
jgi:hypothetical protein